MEVHSGTPLCMLRCGYDFRVSIIAMTSCTTNSAMKLAMTKYSSFIIELDCLSNSYPAASNVTKTKKSVSKYKKKCSL